MVIDNKWKKDSIIYYPISKVKLDPDGLFLERIDHFAEDYDSKNKIFRICWHQNSIGLKLEN